MTSSSPETDELLRRQEERRYLSRSRPTASATAHDEHSRDDSGSRRHVWVLFSLMGGLIYGYNVRYVASVRPCRIFATVCEPSDGSFGALSLSAACQSRGHVAVRARHFGAVVGSGGSAECVSDAQRRAVDARGRRSRGPLWPQSNGDVRLLVLYWWGAVGWSGQWQLSVARAVAAVLGRGQRPVHLAHPHVH